MSSHRLHPPAAPIRAGDISVIVVLLTGLAGCDRQSAVSSGNLQPASAETRAIRRAYAGAPPVIAHPPLSGKCVTCHTSTGSTVPGVGLAPASPHGRTGGIGLNGRCRQCHLFAQTNNLFRDSDFAGFRVNDLHGDRTHAAAPPRIPHPLFMREDCHACHGGPAARPELVCRHAERQNCRQCHVRANEGVGDGPELSEIR